MSLDGSCLTARLLLPGKTSSSGRLVVGACGASGIGSGVGVDVDGERSGTIADGHVVES